MGRPTVLPSVKGMQGLRWWTFYKMDLTWVACMWESEINCPIDVEWAPTQGTIHRADYLPSFMGWLKGLTLRLPTLTPTWQKPKETQYQVHIILTFFQNPVTLFKYFLRWESDLALTMPRNAFSSLLVWAILKFYSKFLSIKMARLSSPQHTSIPAEIRGES